LTTVEKEKSFSVVADTLNEPNVSIAVLLKCKPRKMSALSLCGLTPTGQLHLPGELWRYYYYYYYY